MAEALRFDGRVAVVTGAGGGIGRSIALALGRRGAKVVVNDYGGSPTGEVGTAERAEAVAEEIRKAGGAAVGEGSAVGTAEAAEVIVRKAIDSFGRVDILVNNAGIASPGPLETQSVEAIERVYRTNLIGPHLLARAAWPHMQRQGYGRIVNTSSNAALGTGGNSPYAATKAGLLGLTFDLAVAGRPQGILVNAFMPSAYSRLIAGIPDENFRNWMRDNMPPEKIGEGVAAIVHEKTAVTGKVFVISGGHIARLAIHVSEGVLDKAGVAETYAARMEEILDLEGATLVEFQGDMGNLLTKHFPYPVAGGPGGAKFGTGHGVGWKAVNTEDR